MNQPIEARNWLALARLYRLSQNERNYFVEHIHTLSNWLAKPASFLAQRGFSDHAIHQIELLNWSAIDKELEWLSTTKKHLITINDPHYPLLLKEISWPPIVLFAEGSVDHLSQMQLAMVGSRNPTALGAETAERFAEDLTEQGLIITSGLAMGIDAASHRGALKKGTTIAVLGTGLDSIYPTKNRELTEKILENRGTLLSEFPLGTPAKKENFPWRNRIISGLSVGVLVVEATLKSGSLITAKFAAEQGRELFAIPGSIHNPLARGCNQLVKQGAKVVETSQDVLEEIKQFTDLVPKKNPKHSPKKMALGLSENQPLPLDKEHQKLLSCVDFDVTTVDTIIERSHFSSERVGSMLVKLELQECIQSVSGGYRRTR